ncbi:MAG: hypothetical protein V7641_3710 [Blastocatellia bacterium]
MRARLLNSSLILVVMAGLFALPVYMGFPTAQAEDARLAANLAVARQTHSFKKAKSPDYDSHSMKKVAVVRKQKKHRTKIVARIAPVPLLSLQWWVIAQGEDNLGEWTDPNRMFSKDDRIRFGFKVNQPGYLYIINESLAQNGKVIDPPHILFPASQANRGQNVFAKRNIEYIVPTYCKGISDPDDCWLEVNEQAGKEVITVIFSREMITDLADQLAKADDQISKTFIDQLMADTEKNLEKKPLSPIDLKSQKKGSSQTDTVSGNSYITRVTNKNPKDNEEIIFTFNLNHRD